MGKPICTLECEDCGKFVVASHLGISVFVLDEDIYAMTMCVFCRRPIKNNLTRKVMEHLSRNDVKVFNWRYGKEYEDDKA
jgi:hypothetical protein